LNKTKKKFAFCHVLVFVAHNNNVGYGKFFSYSFCAIAQRAAPLETLFDYQFCFFLFPKTCRDLTDGMICDWGAIV